MMNSKVRTDLQSISNRNRLTSKGGPGAGSPTISRSSTKMLAGTGLGDVDVGVHSTGLEESHHCKPCSNAKTTGHTHSHICSFGVDYPSLRSNSQVPSQGHDYTILNSDVTVDFVGGRDDDTVLDDEVELVAGSSGYRRHVVELLQIFPSEHDWRDRCSSPESTTCAGLDDGAASSMGGAVAAFLQPITSVCTHGRRRGGKKPHETSEID